MNKKYKDQVSLLIRILPVIAKEKDIALHGGTAINLFRREMPRLSVDIDLTYLPLKPRDVSLDEIKLILTRIKSNLIKVFPGINVTGPNDYSEETKLFCNLKGVLVKIEVNLIKRGSLTKPVLKTLCKTAQDEFELHAEISVIPDNLLFGGKICAALDRQHPRDIFDIKYLLEGEGITNEIKYGFIYCLLSSARPINELLNPIPTDQKEVLENHFSGMTREQFTYEDFEKIRKDLIIKIIGSLTDADKKFILSFKSGTPDWSINSFGEFQKFPSINWKLQNINKFKTNSPEKYKRQLDKLNQVLSVEKQVAGSNRLN